MFIGKKMTAGLLIVAATTLIIYVLSYIPAVHRQYAKWLHIQETVYVPHRAPDSAYLGAYEQVKGPFLKPLDTRTDVVVEDHQFNIDMKEGKYHSTTKGYLHIKNDDGTYHDRPVSIDETYHYDTMKTQFPSTRRVPVVKDSVIKKAPDSVHLSSKKDEELKKFWRHLRSVKLPYTYTIGDNIVTVVDRTVRMETIHDTAFVITTLNCSVRRAGSTAPAEKVEMEGTQPLDD